ncbi:Uncharacterised protein [Burkholderia oklahomensis]|nr:hypothetical protein BG90_5760 [Burkholderia oklahomensis C6786]SUY26474.1 Uncharacterised protein [Burkholderia oklahomensis]
MAIRRIQARFECRIGGVDTIGCIDSLRASRLRPTLSIFRTKHTNKFIGVRRRLHDAAVEPHRRCNAHARGFRPSTSAMKSRICAARCRWRRATSHPIRLAIRMHASSPVRVISDARSIASSQAAPRRSISHRKRKPGAVRSSCARRMRRRRSVAGPPLARDRHDAGRRSFEASCTSAIRLRSRASRPDVRPDRADDEGPERHRRSGAFPCRPFPAKRLCDAVRGVAERGSARLPVATDAPANRATDALAPFARRRRRTSFDAVRARLTPDTNRRP